MQNQVFLQARVRYLCYFKTHTFFHLFLSSAPTISKLFLSSLLEVSNLSSCLSLQSVFWDRIPIQASSQSVPFHHVPCFLGKHPGPLSRPLHPCLLKAAKQTKQQILMLSSPPETAGEPDSQVCPQAILLLSLSKELGKEAGRRRD